jgi:hypothetical protein
MLGLGSLKMTMKLSQLLQNGSSTSFNFWGSVRVSSLPRSNKYLMRPDPALIETYIRVTLGELTYSDALRSLPTYQIENWQDYVSAMQVCSRFLANNRDRPLFIGRAYKGDRWKLIPINFDGADCLLQVPALNLQEWDIIVAYSLTSIYFGLIVSIRSDKKGKTFVEIA